MLAMHIGINQKKYFMKKIVLLGLLMFFSTNSFAQKKYRGMDFDDSSYSSIPKKAKLTRGLEIVPAAASLKKICTYTIKSRGLWNLHVMGGCLLWQNYCRSGKK